MKFKVGDVCEIIDGPMPIEWHRGYVGYEVTITSLYSSYGPDFVSVHCPAEPRMARVRVDLLRLKRPPAWNSWLYDTSDVKDERETQIPEDGAIYFMTDDGVKVVRP